MSHGKIPAIQKLGCNKELLWTMDQRTRSTLCIHCIDVIIRHTYVYVIVYSGVLRSQEQFNVTNCYVVSSNDNYKKSLVTNNLTIQALLPVEAMMLLGNHFQCC